MTDEERDAPYWCAYGRWHVVPSLARLCRGHDGKMRQRKDER